MSWEILYKYIYYISIYRSRKVAVCLLRAQHSEKKMHVAMHGTDCVSEVTNLFKELHRQPKRVYRELSSSVELVNTSWGRIHC